MTPTIKKFSSKPLRGELNQPFRISTGQHESMDNILFTLELSDGTKGYGEAAIATHITGETYTGIELGLTRAGRDLISKKISDYNPISNYLHEMLSDKRSAIAAIEMAMLDALTKSLGLPLWRFYGTKTCKISTDITIVIADLDETVDSVKKYYRTGFRKFKLKVGKEWELDLKRLEVVKKLAPGSEIYVDANQAYSVKEALAFVKYCKKIKANVVLLEQPVHKSNWEGLKELTRKSSIPICADESVGNIEECVRAIKEKAVDAINIKFMKFGLVRALDVYRLARAAGIDLMIGAMMESSLATTASAHFAAGLGGIKYIDIDTPFFLKKSVENNPYLSRAGVYDLSKVKAGIGIGPAQGI